jgi:nitric oxide reductase large subunit
MHATAVVWLLMGFVAASLWLYPAQTAATCALAMDSLSAAATGLLQYVRLLVRG